MSMEVKIPAVGESITSGVITTWHKQDGDAVKAGDVLFTLDTDKVSTEITAEDSGTLRIKAEEGAEVKVGEVVAMIEAAAPEEKPKREREQKPAEPREKPAAEEKNEQEQQAETVLSARDTGRIETPAEPAETEKVISAVRNFAGELQVEPPQSPTVARKADGRVTRKRLSPLRRKIAAQLVMAQQNAAILTTFNECDMSGVMELRKRMQNAFQTEFGIKLGLMSFFIKATVKALQDVPAINGWLDGEEFVQNHYYDIGVAVGTERGLVVPVIRDADAKNFGAIEKELADYAGKARSGKLKLEDLQGGVFTISNGGVYGSLLSTPILNPPQSGILGLHKIQDRPVAIGGEAAVRPMMYLALSYDHRVVDGKDAVTFLVKIKEAIEEPARLLLGM
jgi:2-oxoglutarate dehydrogenase E2 component (dihydrolipoamide succinyltransferase)